MTYVHHIIVNCAICKRAVDKTEVQRHVTDNTLKIKVWCHGEIDYCYIDDSFLIEHEGSVLEGEAFGKKGITNERNEENTTKTDTPRLLGRT